jgi:hypothetical protein
MPRVFANRRDWRNFLSHVESGYTPPYAPRLGSLATAARQADVQDLTVAPGRESNLKVFAETQPQ